MEAVAATNKTGCSKKICSWTPSKAFELLPYDLIIEILIWLPARCLITRYTRVCKLWCMIIKSRKFIEKYMQHAEPLLCLSSLILKIRPFQFLYTIDGLILQICLVRHCYRIRNPAANWNLVLPAHEFKSGWKRKGSMSYLPSIDKYKVLSVYFSTNYADFGLKVYTVGVDVTWRPVEVPISFCRNKQRVLDFLTVNGVSFFMKYCRIKCCQTQIIAFQTEDDSFAEIHVPQRVDVLICTRSRFWIIEWDKKLSIWCMLEGEFHIWVLQDFKKAEWDERKIVIPSSVIKQYPFINNNYSPYKIEGTVLIMKGPDRIWNLYYDFKSKHVLEKSAIYERIASSVVNLTSYGEHNFFRGRSEFMVLS